MQKYSNQLNTFSEEVTRKQTEGYFEKYWLTEDEYLRKWHSIKVSIFNQDSLRLPDLMFNEDFELLPLVGENIFVSQEDFNISKDLMRLAGDNYFSIVQNEKHLVEIYNGSEYVIHPFLRFRYPVEISWDEIKSGGLATDELFQGYYKEYFIFGDSGKWGRYAANDYEDPSDELMLTPINLMGFRKDHPLNLKTNFEQRIPSEWVAKLPQP